MTDVILHGRGTGRNVALTETLDYVGQSRSGMLTNAIVGPPPNGNASGSLLTATMSGIWGSATDANVSGALFTETITLSVSGTAFEEVFAPGSTITVTTSLSAVGLVHLGPIDGGTIFEFIASQANQNIYQVSDFDSIYSNGGRITNGLLTGGEYGWTTVFSPGSQGYDDTYSGNGPAAGGTTPGSAFWFSTVGGETLDIRGFRLIGNENITSYENFWTFYGGIGVGNYSNRPYFNLIEAHNPNQGLSGTFTTPTYNATNHYTDYIDEPKFYAPWSHYEFVYISGPRPDVRWANEIWLRVAHSNLDGGDRRPGVAAPSKVVTFTMSSHWSYRTGAGFTTPQEGLFDGMWAKLTDKEDNRKVHLGDVADHNNPVNTVGAYLQFVFPRPVIFKHLQWQNWNNNTEVYSSGNPTKFGKWHWEYSLDSGGSWTAVGGTWWFRENCVDMIAPQVAGTDFNLGPIGPDGKGATHWRMVLDAGPAFGFGHNHYQVRFNLDDVTGQAPPYTIAFTDDEDGALPVPFIGPPGSPFIVKFTDAENDGFATLNLINVPNPVLTIAFTDEGQFDTWADLYPSVVVQTVVITTGR